MSATLLMQQQVAMLLCVSLCVICKLEMARFTCDICDKKYKRKDALRCHILEVHCGKKKQCKYCSKVMRSPSLKRHMEYSCVTRKNYLNAKKKAVKRSNIEEKTENEPNCTAHTKEIEREEEFFRSFLNDSERDPLINGSENGSLKTKWLENKLSEYLKFNV